MKEDVLNNVNNLYEAREMVLNGFKSKIFLAESTGTGLFNTHNSKLKIFTPKQMLQRLPIALAQVKMIIIIKMDTIFINSENSRTSEPHILKLELTDKLDLRIGEKVIALSNLSIYYT